MNKNNRFRFQNGDNLNNKISKTKIKFKNKKNIINLTTIINNGHEILKNNDNELNSLEYSKALKYDKRTYIQYYFSLLKIKNLFIFSFYINNNDYNSQTIKIFLFFFFFSVNFTINALFFNDNSMHKIYIDEGAYNFLYQLPQIIYSNLISSFIYMIIKFLALSENNIIELKKKEKIEIIQIKKLMFVLKIKFSLFFILAFLFLSFFSYYITCFCGIYINTQIHLIKDTFISFGLSLIEPFGLCLIPGIFRILALHNKNNNKKYLYKFSQFIQDNLL